MPRLAPSLRPPATAPPGPRRYSRATVAVAVGATVLIGLHPGGGSADPAAGAAIRSVSATRAQAGRATGDGDVEAAGTDAAAARDARIAAEQRLAELTAARDRMQEEVGRLEGGAAQITEDLAAARRAVREYAVAAYIDGGQSALLAASLSPDESATVAWRRQLIGGQTVSAADSVDRYVALEEANDPARLAAAAELDELNSRVEQAYSDALQAAAHERDAEHALTAARQVAAQAAAVARATEDAAAARATEDARTARAGTTDAVGPRSAPAPGPRAAPPASPTPAPPAPDPAPPTSSGDGPTAEEAALLARIRACESGGNYSIVSSSGRYQGAYQFDARTWAAVGGTGDPAAASPAEQDHRALLLLRQRGRRPWPNCA